MTRQGLALAEAYSRARVHPHMQSDTESQYSRVKKGLLICELLEQLQCELLEQLQRMGSVKKLLYLAALRYQLLT
jgi:hypothetical protein